MADLGFWGSLGNIIYSLIGDEAAKKGNLQQYNQGAELLGLPTWDVDGNMLSNYGDSKQLQNLLGILGQQTDYGNKAMGDMTVSGVKQYSHLMDSTRNRLGGLLGGYNDLQRGTDLRGGALEGRLGAGYDALGQGYGQRESDVMGLLAGMGNTERMDLNEYLSNTADANQAGLRARGLGSSTLTANTRTADNRAALRERGALEERLRTQQAGTLAGLRGDTLGANERGLAATTGLAAGNLDRYANIGMSGLGAQERGNAMLGAVQESGTQNYLGNLGAQANFNLGQYGQQLGMTGQNYANQLGWLQNLQHQGPGVNNAINGAINYYGAMNAPQPQQGEWYDPFIGAGANTAGTLGTLWGANAMFGGGGGALGGLGALSMLSDRTQKTAMTYVDDADILETLDKLPVGKWRYTVDGAPEGDHIGPMAQDFHDAFGLGDDPTQINAVDAIGVLMAAVKGLKAEVDALRAERN